MQETERTSCLSDKSRKRCSLFLVWACFLLFVTMMASKNVYTAELVTLVNVFEKSKAEVSLAMTYYFVIYAIMQLVLSVLMPKINLRIYITITAGLSSILTILISIGNLDLIYVLCAVNGGLQAGIYAGCMSVISKYLLKNLLPFANTVMSVGTPVSSMISYGAAALFVGMGRWELPFIILGGFFLVSVVIFFIAVTLMKRFPPEVVEDHGHIVVAHEEKPYVTLKTGKDKGLYMGIILMVVLVSNCMHYSIMNWLPSMLNKIFGMPESASILISIIAPLIMFLFSFVAIYTCEKQQDIIKVFGVFMIIAVIAYLPLVFVFDVNIILTLALIILFIGLASAGRVVLAGVISFKMRSQINTGSYMASTNAMASIAAGVMPTVTGCVIDAYGYQAFFYVVLGVVALCSLLSVILFFFIEKKRRSL